MMQLLLGMEKIAEAKKTVRAQRTPKVTAAAGAA